MYRSLCGCLTTYEEAYRESEYNRTIRLRKWCKEVAKHYRCNAGCFEKADNDPVWKFKEREKGE